MNIDELIAAGRPDPSPASAVVDSHRGQLLQRTRAQWPAPVASIPRSDAAEVDVRHSMRSEWPARRRWVLAMSAALVVVVGAVGILVNIDDAPGAVSTDAASTESAAPSTESSPQTTTGTESAGTGSTVPAGTTGTPTSFDDGAVQRINSADLPAFVGPIEIDLHPANIDVAQVNGMTLHLDMSDDEFCIEFVPADAAIPTQRMCGAAPGRLTMQGFEHVSEVAKSHPVDVEPAATASFAVVIFTPDAATLRLLAKDGSPACDLAAHPVPEIGPMTVWTCDGTDVVRPWDLEATVAGQTVIAEVPMMPPFPDGPFPNIGDRIPDIETGGWLTSGASEVTSRIGPLIPVGRDGVVIGYIEAFTPPSLTPPSDEDPSLIIYNGNATPIGRFVNGLPVLDSDPPTTTS